ncbi:hypothetical protein A1507_12645 [Methylomonas koyamae]|uniref:DUF2281 domain-containing protein n=1 Tax=Methylomonas koyamae TaxID=702114 RepID=A0A177ND03_9GAMM|nr:DUF2281 domain-containing protein [Methylomonas koyamae]OAI15927.1 hypothetical protein A1507_12645 [Methylomonas koyamae]
MSVFTQQILEDIENLPPEMQAEALDFVHFLRSKWIRTEAASKLRASNSGEAVAVMVEIAARATAFQGIDTPEAWQREVRQDRPLPGRD